MILANHQCPLAIATIIQRPPSLSAERRATPGTLFHVPERGLTTGGDCDTVGEAGTA